MEEKTVIKILLHECRFEYQAHINSWRPVEQQEVALVCLPVKLTFKTRVMY